MTNATPSAMSGGGPAYTLQPAKGDASLGTTKSGYLNKRSDTKYRLRPFGWSKRRCVVRYGILEIYHSDESKQPARLELHTCKI